MSQSHKDLMKKVIEQFDIADVNVFSPDFDDAKLLRIDISKSNQNWIFHIHNPNIFLFEKFQLFTELLSKNYERFGGAKAIITTEENVFVNETLIQDYWAYILDAIKDESSVSHQILLGQTPKFVNNQIQIHCPNELTKTHLVKNCIPKIQQAYIEVGFPKLGLHIQLDDEMHEKMTELFEQKEQQIQDDFNEAQKNAQMMASSTQKNKPMTTNSKQEGVIYGKIIKSNSETRAIADIFEEERNVVIEGKIFDIELRRGKAKGKLFGNIKLTDYTSSISATLFPSTPEDEAALEGLKKGTWVKAFGSIEVNKYSQELGMIIRDMNLVKHEGRKDTFEGEKRVELHMHTNMSVMDATNSPSDLISQAAKWGHKAIAITDHANLQAYPEAHGAGKKNGIKILYGLEGNIVDDHVNVAYNPQHILLEDATYVVFDVETTGLSAIYDSIIELAAVKMKNGVVIDKFEEFIDPGHPLSATTIQLTGITDDMVRGSKSVEQVLKEFHEFSKDCILVAHNASFDMGFLNTGYENVGLDRTEQPVIDTLELSRMLHPQLKSHRLNTLAKRYNVALEQHHRSV